MHSNAATRDQIMRHGLDDDVEYDGGELHEFVDEKEIGVIGVEQGRKVLANLSMNGTCRAGTGAGLCFIRRRFEIVLDV